MHTRVQGLGFRVLGFGYRVCTCIGFRFWTHVRTFVNNNSYARAENAGLSPLVFTHPPGGPHAQTESGGRVLAVNAGARAPRGGVTRKGVVLTDLQSPCDCQYSSSLSLSLSLSLLSLSLSRVPGANLRLGWGVPVWAGLVLVHPLSPEPVHPHPTLPLPIANHCG